MLEEQTSCPHCSLDFALAALSPKTYFLCNYISKNTISILPFFLEKWLLSDNENWWEIVEMFWFLEMPSMGTQQSDIPDCTQCYNTHNDLSSSPVQKFPDEWWLLIQLHDLHSYSFINVLPIFYAFPEYFQIDSK